MTPPQIAALVAVAAAVWLAWRARPFALLNAAMRTARRVPISAGNSTGVVRIEGKAEPADVPEGFARPGTVWQETDNFGGAASVSKGTRSVARILVRDDTADCLVLAEEAYVIPSGRDVETHRRIFGDDDTRVTRYIPTGAHVIGIGVLGNAKDRAGSPRARCKLHRSRHGVLMLSGATERATHFHLRFHLTMRIAGAVACLAAGNLLWNLDL